MLGSVRNENNLIGDDIFAVNNSYAWWDYADTNYNVGATIPSTLGQLTSNLQNTENIWKLLNKYQFDLIFCHTSHQTNSVPIIKLFHTGRTTDLSQRKISWSSLGSMGISWANAITDRIWLRECDHVFLIDNRVYNWDTCITCHNIKFCTPYAIWNSQ